MSNEPKYPYQDLLPELIKAIFSSLELLTSPETKENEHYLINSYFIGCFDLFGKKGGANRHLIGHNDFGIVPIYASEKNKKTPNKKASRISNLIKNIYQESQDLNKLSKPAVVLPSPLYIAYRILTAPFMPASKDYALLALKTYLLQSLKLVPDYGELTSNQSFDKIKIHHIKQALEIIHTYAYRKDNFPSPDALKEGKKSQYFLYQLLSMLGYINLRFKDEDKRTKYCKAKLLFSDEKPYELRIHNAVQNLPNIAELSNLIWGNPIPIQGADTVFLGGLQTNKENNLVIGIHGDPGAGKTTFCLSYAISMAPFGVEIKFISNEEKDNSLKARTIELVSENLRRLDFFPQPLDTWFETAYSNNIKCLEKEMSILKFKTNDAESIIKGIPLPPNIVVIDGIHQYFPDDEDGINDKYRLYNFVNDCRALNMIVILTVSRKWKQLKKLDHLLDVVIDLEYSQTNDLEAKPQRLFTLSKTRNQASRGGTHLFHLSHDDGFKIVPQIPSQMDLRSKTLPRLPSKDIIIDIINSNDAVNPEQLLYRGSHILIYGKSSSGKAGFALNIALSPEKKHGEIKTNKRILIISFLYPKKYYSNLKTRIVNRLKNNNPNTDSKIEAMCLYPGYLSPEDLYSKITLKLEQAELEGFPYDAIIIDGLHNITRQFPRISSYDLFWSVLYNALKKRDLTVISTHTLFIIEDADEKKPEANVKINDEDIKPLLHALVQASDAIVILDKKQDGNNKIFNVRFKETIFNHPKNSIFDWDKEACKIIYEANKTKEQSPQKSLNL